MHPDQHPEPVSFMSNEEGDDLVVSFAVNQDAPEDVLSVILMRTPKFEGLLEPSKRGVHVSHEAYPDSDDEYLRRFSLESGIAEIVTTRRSYLLDVSRVDEAELKEARRILKKMNRDGVVQLDPA